MLLGSLTEREQEILACMVEGLSNQAIANRLHLAGNSVRWYNSQIYSKLGVKSRDEAVKQSQSLGLFAAKSDKAQPQHNLSAQATHFVGRQRELQEISLLLKNEHIQLITILAPGGMGKTRLSLEVAQMQIANFADGVYFVPLAFVNLSSDIITTIAETIGFVFHDETAPIQQFVNFLENRRMLLVLDNFEHLLDGAEFLSKIIKASRHLKIIVTSRERLNLQCEAVYDLRGLAFPGWETPDDAMEYDAVKLFMQSAQRVRTNFALSTNDLDFLARICRLTAGMPLGIELAAGWLDVLSLEQIARELEKGIDILETDIRDVPERHRSLRATFEQTWERLTPDEQIVFARLSVFRGGFTLESASAIAAATICHLRKLAQKALIQTESNERYGIHALLQQFGDSKLSEIDNNGTIQRKHAAFFADFMAERKKDLQNGHQIEALEWIDFEFENVRSAWQYIVNYQEWNQLPKFLYSLWFYLDSRSRGQSARELFEPAVKFLRAIPATTASQITMGRIMAYLSWFIHDIGLSEVSAKMSNEAIHILRQSECSEDLIFALHARTLMAWFQNHSELMLELSQEGLSLARLHGDRKWEGVFLTWLGSAHIFSNIELALEYTEAGVAILETFNDHQGLLQGVIAMSFIKERQGNYEEALYWIEKLRLLAQSMGNSFLNAFSYVVQGRILLAQNADIKACTNLGKGLQLYWDAGYTWFIAFPLTYIVQLLIKQKALERAVELRAAIDKCLVNFEQANHLALKLCNLLETEMPSESFAEAWACGTKKDLAGLVNELLVEMKPY